MNSKQSGRRRLLKGSVALVGGLAVGALRPAAGQETTRVDVIRPTGVRPEGEVSRFVKSVRRGTATNGLTPLQDSKGIITPSRLHFYVNHEAGILPDIDPAKHRLMIFGMVDRPLVLTMEELMRLPSVSRLHFLECNANSNEAAVAGENKTVQDTHGLTSCSEWTGVLLSLLLKEAGVQKGASWVIAESADTAAHASSIPLEKAMEDSLVAYFQNGEPMRVENGFPLRLIVPGYGGRAHVKWVKGLKVVDQPYMTTQDRSSHMDHTPAGEGAFLLTSDLARRYHVEMYAKAVITFPSPGHRLPGPGFYEIIGLAWSGGGAIRKVEVSTDGGRTWKDAQIQEPIHRRAHTRFHFPWTWNGEEAVLESRCTDENGDVQPAVAEVNKNWGTDQSSACRDVLGDNCNLIPRRANRSYIQPWRVARDGTLHNAFVPGQHPADIRGVSAGTGIHH